MADDDEWADSDLTDLSDSDSDTGSVYAASKKKAAPVVKLNPPLLRAPRNANYSVDSLRGMIKRGEVDLNPEYQRDVVWSVTKQAKMIDSLMHNFYVPPIIFSVKEDSEKGQIRTCIDGKQRLTSISRFMDNEIIYKDSRSGIRHSFDRHVAPAKIMHKTDASRFRNVQIVCYEYDQITDDQEREIFSRVQNGMPLSTAERLQAVTGPLATFTRHVQKTILHTYTEWNTERGRDFQCIAAAIYIAERLPQSMQWPSQGPLENFLSRDTDLKPELKKKLLVAFKSVPHMASDPLYNKGFRDPTRPSPIEFISIVLLLFCRQSEFGLVQAADAIVKMRKDMRKNYRQQLRMNSTLVKHTVRWIKALQISTLKSDGEGDKPISKETVVHSNAPSRTPADASTPQRTQTKGAAPAKVVGGKTPVKTYTQPEPTSSTAKRKRVIVSDEEDDTPISHMQSPKKNQSNVKSTPKLPEAQPPTVAKKRQLARPSVTPGQPRPTQGASGSAKPNHERSSTEDQGSRKSVSKPQVSTDTPNRRMASLPSFKKKGPDGPTGSTSTSQSPVSSSNPSPMFDTTRPSMSGSSAPTPRTSIGAVTNPPIKTEAPEMSINTPTSALQGSTWSFLENARGIAASPVDYTQTAKPNTNVMSPPPFSPYASSTAPGQGQPPHSAPGTTTIRSSFETSHPVPSAGISDVLPPTPNIGSNQRRRFSSFAPA